MRAKVRTFLILFCGAIFFAGCGELSSSSPNLSHDRITGHRKVDEQASSLQGQWLFNDRLDGLNGASHFVVEARFLTASGFFALHSYFNGFSWRDGVEVKIQLQANGDLSLAVQVPNYSAQVVKLPPEFIGPDGRLRLRIEVHNVTPAGVRVLVWNDKLSLQGEVDRPRGFVSAANADFDSKAKGWYFQDHGHGVRWGLEFENAHVLSTYREAPYVAR